MKLYKLTNSQFQTYNDTQWGENVTHKTDGSGELCSGGWLHAYEHPLIAALLNPIHADIINPVLWESIGNDEVKRDNQLKIGVTQLTTIRQIPLPEVTIEQRVKFAILCAKKVCKDTGWNLWADRWLSGEDRSKESAVKYAFGKIVGFTDNPLITESVGASARTAAAAVCFKLAISAAAAVSWAVSVDACLDLIAIAEEAMKD